jgi:NAD(P)-dependent dehydrogenase (short-subunit alcohol dehydrogenase family)
VTENDASGATGSGAGTGRSEAVGPGQAPGPAAAPGHGPIALTGKKAIVTGASRGIGREIAVAFARAGADVALVARDAEKLAEVAAEVEAAGRKAVVLPCDVTDPEAVGRMADDAVAALGYVDVLVNNAGGTSFMVPFTQLRFAGWEKTMRLNVDSVVHVTQAVGRHMVERKSGAIVNVASVAGLTGTPALAPYGASKAALVSLTRTLAAEWATEGVRVNALCPGWTATDLNRNLWEDEQATALLMAGVPMRRWAQPAEMAGPAVFLASDAASFVTGQTLAVDGGLTVL